MKRIELKRLRIRNFKGTRDLTAEFGPATTVSGGNGTGKTTLFDAFTWCLFGKDSAGRTDSGRGSFTLKTVDATGRPIEKLEHSVSALLSVDGSETEFTRSLAEKWVKPRGSAETELQGNETHYIVDGLEVKASRYAETVAALCGEDLFRLLTSPSYFPNLDWQSQRDILMTMAGGVTLEEVAAGRREFEEILSKIAGRDLADFRRDIAYRKKSVRTEMEECPVRISAIQGVTPAAPDYAALEKERESLLKEQSQVEAEIADVAEANRRRFESEKERIRAANDIALQQQKILAEARQKAQKRGYEANARHNELRAKLDAARREYTTFVTSDTRSEEEYCRRLQDLNGRADSLRSEREEKLKEWNARNAEEYRENEGGLICPIYRTLCSDASVLKTDAEARAKAREAFMARKNADLDRITEEGRRIKEAMEKAAEDIAEYSKTVKEARDAADARKRELQDGIAALSKELEATPAVTVATDVRPEDLPEWAELEAKRTALVPDGKPTDSDDGPRTLAARRAEIASKLEAVNSKLAVRRTIEANEARMEEIRTREKELAQQLADLEREEFAADGLDRARIDEVERRVNGLFRTVRFRMFDRQLNGGEVPTCVAMVDGVRYSDLNTACRINAGLDIINALCRFHGVSAPVFIDRAESVNELFPVDSQLIRLCVSLDDGLTFSYNQ